MGLLKKFRSGAGHIHVRSLLITIPRAIERQALPRNENILLGSSDQASYHKNPCLVSQQPFGESIILLFAKGSINQCQRVPALPLFPLNYISTLWNGKEKMIPELICLSFLCLSLVVEVLDLSLLDISI